MIKILSIFVFLSLKLFAQENISKEVYFNEFLNKAINNSPYLKALHLNINQTSLKGEILTRYKNPSLELEYAYFNAPSKSSENGYRVALSQEITLFNVMSDKEKASISMHEKSQAKYLLWRALFVKEVSFLFAEYAQEKDLYSLKQEELFIAKRIYDISQERYKAGTISKGKMFQAKVDFEMLEVALSMKEISYKDKYFKLLELAGYFVEIELNHKHKFSVNSNISLNPDLILLEKTKKYALDMASVDANKIQAIDLVLEYEDEPDQDILRLGFEIPLAIFNTKDQEKEIAKIQAKKLDNSIEKHSSTISFKILQLRQKRDLLEGIKNKNSLTLVTQKKLLTMFEDAYKIANVNLLELQNVKNKLVQTKKNLIENKFALDENAIETNYIAGVYNE